jgi:serine/threonine-protein kinase
VQEPLVGSLIANRYRVVRRLGAGGMGTVYVALQEGIEREVALKVVRRDLAGDQVALERFRREAQALAQAHHPHVVTLFDFGPLPGGLYYFAMELVKGQTLRQRLRARGPILAKATIPMMRQVCGALAAAHKLNIVHRDLKPENILLMEAAGTPDFVKILDFGVAKVVKGESPEQSAEQQLTDRNSVVGTPGYIAPEVSLHGNTTDPRSDLYALGVIWYECLAGRQPFTAPTPTALIMAHAIDPVQQLPSEVPLPVAGLVLRLLAKDPNDRPSSAEELVAIIDALPQLGSHHTPAATPAMFASPHGPTADNTPRSNLFARAQQAAEVSAEQARQSMMTTQHSPPLSIVDAPVGEVTESGPAPTAPGLKAKRGPAMVAAALALVLALAAVAFALLRPDPNAHASHDAGPGPRDLFVATGDAGPNASDGGVSARDGGASARDGGASTDVTRDGGASVDARDAGVDSVAADAGPKKRKPRNPNNPKPPDEHDPDLGD